MDAGNLAVDVILGDEMRAAETIRNAVTGRPVTGAAVADALVTIGSDALMFVPGLGAVAAAARAGRAARTAAKGVKASQKVSKASAEIRNLKSAKTAVKKGYAIKFTKRDAKSLAKNEAIKAKAQRTVNQAAAKLKMTEKPTEARFRTIEGKSRKLQAAAKKKYNSPRRKKMRRTGNTISTTKDILDLGRAYDREIEE